MKKTFLLLLVVLVGCQEDPTCKCTTYHDGEFYSQRDYRADGGCFEDYRSNTITRNGREIFVEEICETQ